MVHDDNFSQKGDRKILIIIIQKLFVTALCKTSVFLTKGLKKLLLKTIIEIVQCTIDLLY